MFHRLTALFLLAALLPYTFAFFSPSFSPHHTHATHRISELYAEREAFEVMVDLPGEGLSAKMKFKPVLENSELVEVRYQVPFGLDVAPQNNMAVCTKAGANGEQPGDILRYTSQWTLGLPRGDGVITTAMSFSGGISWQVSMFDVLAAKRWDDVVAALVSNEKSRTDEVVLLFERPIKTD